MYCMLILQRTDIYTKAAVAKTNLLDHVALALNQQEELLQAVSKLSEST